MWLASSGSANKPVIELPPEMCAAVARALYEDGDYQSLMSLSYVSHALFDVTSPFLYKVNVDKDNSSALFWATERGDLDLAKKLVRHGATFKQTQGEATLLSGVFGPKSPITLAMALGNDQMVEFYLSLQHINVNHPGPEYASPLMCAVREGNVRRVTLLVNHPNIDIKAENKHKRTALSYAAERGDVAIFNLLFVSLSDEELDQKCILERTLASYAAEKGNLAIVQLLAGQGADITHRCKANLTPFDFAAKMGHINMVQWFMSHHNVDPEGQPWPALNLAATNGHTNLVRWLLTQTNVNPNGSCQFAGRTALMRAASIGNIDLLNVLLSDARVDPDLHCNEGLTALTYAAANGHPDALVWLLSHPRINPCLINHLRQDVLVQTIAHGPHHWGDNGLTIVKILLDDPRIYLTVRDVFGNTARNYAMAAGDDVVMGALTEGGVPMGTPYSY